MEVRTGIALALVMSGKYYLPQTQTVKGRDQYGEFIDLQIPTIDNDRLERDIEAIMRGEMASPVKLISGIMASPFLNGITP